MDAGRRKFFIVAGGLVLLLLAVLVVRQLRGQPRAVHALTVGNAPFTIALPESGVIQYPQIQTMSTEISGNIGRIFVKAGDRVGEGQLLATIENPQISSQASSSAAAYRAASARAESAQATGGSNVAQAQANLEAARARLAQAQQDMANGLQSGLGYGQTTAADQRAQAEANVATTTTALREATRVYLAYSDLYRNKAISRDQLDKAEAAYEQAQVANRQALLARSSLGTQLSRSKTVLEDNLRSAQAALATARVESGPGDVAAASAEASRAASEYAFAREQANATQIRAPYAATVLSVATEKNDSLRPLQPGDAVGVGQPVVTLAQSRAFVVRTRVDEQDVINVRLGERAQITGEDFPGRVLSGHVVEISPIAQGAGNNSSGRTVATTILVERPPDFLRDGMSVNVNILTTDLQHAIVVPNEAIVRDGGQSFVYVVRNGNAYRQPVRISLSNEGSSVVASGLRDGDVIVAQSVPGLADGAPVSMASLSSAVQR